MSNMDRVITSREIAEACGVDPVTVRQWRTRFDDFPNPIRSFGKTAVFDPAAVDVWLDAHNRKHGPLIGQ
jgi:predicted DNA-binding transcriptional regulator AlpA